MNLAFSHVFPKKAGTLYQKPTHFGEKILFGLFELGLKRVKELRPYSENLNVALMNQKTDLPKKEIFPKIHTIRRDEKKRWNPGMNIHFVMFQRRPWQINFAPVLPVKAVEDIQIFYDGANDFKPWVYIGGKQLEKEEVETLSRNDGFDSVEDFFQYFNEDFEGKLIHWTDKVYNPKEIEVNDAEEVTGRKCDCFMGANDPERTCQCETPEQAIQRMNNSKR